MSIPDFAVELINSQTSSEFDSNASTIIVVGSKSVGKSNLLHNFLDKSDVPKETLVVDYLFGRKSLQKQGIDKIICHVWEYGGRLEMLKNVLPSIPFQGKCYYCVMLDLSKVRAIWKTLEICFQAMKHNSENSSIFPELIVIGGKYDLFKNFDTEVKKNVCATIRSFAMIYNADVIYYSIKEVHLVRRIKEIFNSIGFGKGCVFKEKNTNYNKPLLISKGSDTWESIGLPASTMEQVKDRHYSRIAPETEVKQDIKSLPQSHPEPILDSLAALKYEELRNMECYDPSIDDYLILLP